MIDFTDYIPVETIIAILSHESLMSDTYILTGSDDGTARLWDVDYHTTMRYLCSRLLRDFTNDEREQYGITDHSPTCPSK